MIFYDAGGTIDQTSCLPSAAISRPAGLERAQAIIQAHTPTPLPFRPIEACLAFSTTLNKRQTSLKSCPKAGKKFRQSKKSFFNKSERR